MARLVARGFSQQYGEDYEETFSPVAKMTSVWVVIALAACQGWKMRQLDVKNVFLYGEIDKDIFMVQPLGYVSEVHPGHVCKLRKALYGLKQTPRAWYGKIAEYLQFCGYLASDSDSSLFIKKRGELHVLVLLYVDDIIVTGNSEEEVARLRAELAIRFEMKDLGETRTIGGRRPIMFSHVDQRVSRDAARSRTQCPSLLRKQSTKLRPWQLEKPSGLGS
ncbi:hypothetical protein KSP39_PZI020254 [Platanthera zijinensis]|uniref:Reverse transcriptase Ty1/copia-type domain-containing protein n=1 Tax=Platanthera zijinensis TaxID=2320716 RepID=A0AAP0B0N7_9ASPA